MSAGPRGSVRIWAESAAPLPGNTGRTAEGFNLRRGGGATLSLGSSGGEAAVTLSSADALQLEATDSGDANGPQTSLKDVEIERRG